MKKYIIIVCIGILVIFGVIKFISIPRIKVVKCTSNVVESNYSIDSKYKIYHKKDIVSKVEIVKEIKSNNKTILNYYVDNYKNEYKRYNDLYGGYKVDSSNKDNIVELNIEFDLSKVNMSKLLSDNLYLNDDINNNELKLDGVYKLYNLDKSNCR